MKQPSPLRFSTAAASETGKSDLPTARQTTIADPTEVKHAQTRPTDPQTWLDRHGDALFRFAMARLGHRDLAEETVQETFLAALQARNRFAAASSERTWLLGILKHKVVDCFRRLARDKHVFETPADDEAMAALFERGYWRCRPSQWTLEPEATIENREFRAALMRCLARLPEGLGNALRLREADQLETTEICDILGITPTNLATLLHRARARLRSCLDQTWFGRAGRDSLPGS